MKLVASLIVHDELDRYLEPCIASLVEFCDEIRVLDDNSSDGTAEWLINQADRGVRPLLHKGNTFFEHEGQARQRLFEWTLKAEPTHILTVDADEFVSDGAALRSTLEEDQETLVWTMPIEEVWNAGPSGLSIRVDGGWSVGSNQLYRAPDSLQRRTRSAQWGILDRALACGRNPIAIRNLPCKTSGVSLLHFGWTNKNERDSRYQRYVEHDSGAYHNKRHLDSIMFPDNKVVLRHRNWPAVIDRDEILRRSGYAV